MGLRENIMSEINLYDRLGKDFSGRGHFKLYATPNCRESERVKRFLNEKRILYDEIDARPYTEGRKEIYDFYAYSENGMGKKQIKKDKDGDIILPILRWVSTWQGEEISELLKMLDSNK